MSTSQTGNSQARKRSANNRKGNRRSSQQENGDNRKIPAPTLVQTRTDFLAMIDRLDEQPVVALDTESDSLYSYYPRVCLIQISICADSQNPDPHEVLDYLVDPLQLAKLDELGDLMAEPATEVILHAAENDILILQRDFDFSFENIYDTQLAARILGRNRVGLAAMLEKQFGVVSNKRMQRTNWGRRPLTPQQMTYAQMDTHYLLALRQRQIQELKAAGRWREAQEAFQQLSQISYADRPENERTFWQMKHTRDVARQDTGLLEELWLWREETAQHLDRPPFKVMNGRTLIELVQHKPDSLTALAEIRGLSKRQIQRFGREVLDAIERGQERPLPDLPEPTPRDDQQMNGLERVRYDALRSWRTAKAEKRGVDPDIVFSNDILQTIAQAAPDSEQQLASIPAVGEWKAQTYGPEILDTLANAGRDA